MIKINLVSEGRRPVVARKAKEALGVGDTSLGELLMIGFIIVGLLLTAGWWYNLSRQIDKKEQEIATAKKEVERLKAVLKEVEEYEKRKLELEHKIKVINQLKANQSGPVKIMDYVSTALPELLWLDKMELRGQTLRVGGRAFNTNQVATFIENLNKVPEFAEPKLQETSQARGGSYYTFAINFDFSFQAPAEEESADQQAQAAAGG